MAEITKGTAKDKTVATTYVDHDDQVLADLGYVVRISLFSIASGRRHYWYSLKPDARQLRAIPRPRSL